MGVTVHSPFSGQPVKIRDQDVGRAVRDEEGRIFYVLARSSGEGYYGAPTRAGGAKDEERYNQMLARISDVRGHVEDVQEQHVHDARGRRRSNIRGKIVIFILALMVLTLVYLFTIGPLAYLRHQWTEPPADKPIRVGLLVRPGLAGALC